MSVIPILFSFVATTLRVMAWRPRTLRWHGLLVMLLVCAQALAHREEGDITQSARLFRPLAEQGNAMAQYNLGVLYATGQGVKRDYREAAKWYRRAAAQGVVHAQHKLGNLYLQGHGVPRNAELAHLWHSLAAAQGHADAALVRDKLTHSMSRAQIAEAEKRAAQCKQYQYRDCE